MHLKMALKMEYGQPNEQVSLDSFVRTPPIPAQDNHETLIAHRCPDNSRVPTREVSGVNC